MKFRYIISDEDGNIFGTNSEATARHHYDGDALVVDCKTGLMFGTEEVVQEAEAPPEDEDDEDEPEDD